MNGENGMYANRNRTDTLREVMRMLTEALAENGKAGRWKVFAGAGIYAASFVAATFGAKGAVIGLVSALIGSGTISHHVSPWNETGKGEHIGIWLNRRIEAPPEPDSEARRREEEVTENPAPTEKIEAEDLQQPGAISKEEVTVPEENEADPDIKWNGGTDKDGYASRRPLLKASRLSFLLFNGKEGMIVALDRDRSEFECPLCGETVAAGLNRCPSCGISFSNLKSGMEGILLPDLDEYGNSILPEDTRVKGIHFEAEEGVVTIYGTREKKTKSGEDSFGDNLLAGIATIS